MKSTTIWVGLDVHKESISVAVFEDRHAQGRPGVCIPNDAGQIRKLFSRLKKEGEVHACYEAGSCGYEVYRQLAAMGIACDVIAPGLIPVRVGDRVKTDRRDAEKLARLFRAGELTSIRVPTLDQEIAQQAEKEPYKAMVGRLRCLRGIDTLSAMALIELAGFVWAVGCAA